MNFQKIARVSTKTKIIQLFVKHCCKPRCEDMLLVIHFLLITCDARSAIGHRFNCVQWNFFIPGLLSKYPLDDDDILHICKKPKI